MVDFRYYLGRQGVRGQRGEKGDAGFSPFITEKTNTKEEYVLHIQNETDDTSFDTPNLKEGLVPEDMGGTYVRLNRETGNQYYGNIDEATETIKGVVKLEPDETVLTPTSETSVITAEQAVQNYTKKTETQDLQNIVTVNSGDIDKLQDMEYVSSVGIYGSDLTVQKSKNGVITTNATIPLPTKGLSMTADDILDNFTLSTIANELLIRSDGKIVLSAGNQGTLIINDGVKFKDYYQKEYDLLNATPTVIDGGDSTSV